MALVRPPRRRGGFPKTDRRVTLPAGSSPPTRGFSDLPGAPATGAVVLPADAGVFRLGEQRKMAEWRPPRRRGGFPWFGGSPRKPAASSPPTRGCSDGLHRRRLLGGVLPSDAGVFRCRRRSTTGCPCPPRRRGGVPPRGQRVRRPRPSSPPTRGCSGPLGDQRWHSSVLPADAGVFRRLTAASLSRPGLPRRRGGFPTYLALQLLARSSSPPTRGFSDWENNARWPSGVLPADAGVFRGSAAARGSRPRPPRQRGGVPTDYIGAVYSAASSPPTRGCSDAAVGVRPAVRVLPADAGVFRPEGSASGGRGRPPRRRGGAPPAESG